MNIKKRTIVATNCTPAEAIDMVRNIEDYFHGEFTEEIDMLVQRRLDNATGAHPRQLKRITVNSARSKILKATGLSYLRLLHKLQKVKVK
jgi:hypothetical protein